MPYARPFLRVRLEGTLGNTEQFSMGVNMGWLLGSAPLYGLDETEAALFATWWTTQARISNVAHLRTVKANLIDVDGHYVSEETVRWDYTDSIPAGAYAATLPLQCSLVYSFTTDADRGRASRGRTYVPAPSVVLEAPDMRLTVGNQADHVTCALQLLETLETAFPGYQPVIVSNLGAGHQRNITGVRVGRAVDTIRSRREGVLEDYQEAPYPTV